MVTTVKYPAISNTCLRIQHFYKWARGWDEVHENKTWKLTLLTINWDVPSTPGSVSLSSVFSTQLPPGGIPAAPRVSAPFEDCVRFSASSLQHTLNRIYNQDIFSQTSRHKSWNILKHSQESLWWPLFAVLRYCGNSRPYLTCERMGVLLCIDMWHYELFNVLYSICSSIEIPLTDFFFLKKINSSV